MTEAEMQELISKVTAKRARTFLDHVLKHGFITTNELKTLYKYNHPPRAAQDVRDHGIPIEQYKVQGPDGRSIAAYKLGDPKLANASKLGGRAALPKKLKDELLKISGEECTHCNAHYPAGRGLQIDHRIPYEIGGDEANQIADDFMLLCGSCNRSKSFSCENCRNWTIKDKTTCASCLWASPERYDHVAMAARRQLSIAWDGDETQSYDAFAALAKANGQTASEYAKAVLSRRSCAEKTS